MKYTPTSVIELAKLLDLSRGTVSSILNGIWKQRRISPKTAQFVLDFASQVRFQPNNIGLALRGKSITESVVLFPVNPLEHYRNALFSLMEELDSIGKDYLILPVSTKSLNSCLQVIKNYRVQEVLIFATVIQKDVLKDWQVFFRSISDVRVFFYDFPYELISPKSFNFINRTAFIGINRYKAQKQIFDYTWNAGYRRWFLLEHYNQKRYNKLYSSTVTRNFWTFPANLKNWQDLGEAMGKQIIENYINDPGWAICSNDDKTTWAAIKYLTDHKIRVPEDFAFISWDGLIESDFTQVPLTTLIIPHQQMLQFAIEWFKSPDMENQNITLDTKIRKGETLPIRNP